MLPPGADCNWLCCSTAFSAEAVNGMPAVSGDGRTLPPGSNTVHRWA